MDINVILDSDDEIVLDAEKVSYTESAVAPDGHKYIRVCYNDDREKFYAFKNCKAMRKLCQQFDH